MTLRERWESWWLARRVAWKRDRIDLMRRHRTYHYEQLCRLDRDIADAKRELREWVPF